MKKAMKSSFLTRFFLLSALLMPSARAVGDLSLKVIFQYFIHGLNLQTNLFEKAVGVVTIGAFLTSGILSKCQNYMPNHATCLKHYSEGMLTLGTLSGMILVISMHDDQ
jgi:hypothetical protein